MILADAEMEGWTLTANRVVGSIVISTTWTTKIWRDGRAWIGLLRTQGGIGNMGVSTKGTVAGPIQRLALTLP